MPIITTHPTTGMSSDFFSELATTVSIQAQPDFLASQFGGDISVPGLFERTAYQIARNLSVSYEPCGFTFAQCKEHNAFFMYPSDDAKQYAIETFDEDDAETYDYIDNRVFGMIVTLRALEDSSCRNADEQAITDIICEMMENLQRAISHTVSAICGASSKLDNDDKAHVRYMADMLQKHTE